MWNRFLSFFFRSVTVIRSSSTVADVLSSQHGFEPHRLGWKILCKKK